MLEADEHADLDRHYDLAKPKFTMTECMVAVTLSLAIVTLLAVFLVERIEDVVESGIPDQFLGLIMLPLVEKAAEHLTAIDEAWDGQIVSYYATFNNSMLTNGRILRSSIALVLPSRRPFSTLHSSSLLAGSWAKIWTSTSKSS